MSKMSNRGKKVTKYVHTGYAFDGAAGHDLIVTDKLVNRIQSAIKHQLEEGPTIFGQYSNFTKKDSVRSIISSRKRAK